jgi:hypothetical protein
MDSNTIPKILKMKDIFWKNTNLLFYKKEDTICIVKEEEKDDFIIYYIYINKSYEDECYLCNIIEDDEKYNQFIEGYTQIYPEKYEEEDEDD